MSSTHPFFVSIITICLNEEKRITQTLSSIVNQTYPNKELIIIDGGSTDSTLNIINKYKQNITRIVSEKDNGIYHAMNKGVSLANGDYIIFINGGDELYSSNVLDNIFSQKDITEDILYGKTCFIYPDERKTVSIPPGTISTVFLANNALVHQSVFCKSSLFDKIGAFCTEYRIASDYDFLVRAILIHKCSTKYLNNIISKFYLDGISNTVETKPEMRQERLLVQLKYLPRPLYYFSRVRYWMISKKNQLLLPRWLQKIANYAFARLFQPKEIQHK